jgi:hypothetical protein
LSTDDFIEPEQPELPGLPEQSELPDQPEENTGLSSLMGSTDDLAGGGPQSSIDKILAWVPRVLSSKPHVLVLLGLGIYLIILPLTGVRVSSNAELIGGNYTNVTSDIGACIAAGGTLHLVGQNRKRRRVEEERLRLAQETHRLLHFVCGDAARQLGHITVVATGTMRHQPPAPPFGGDDGPELEL